MFLTKEELFVLTKKRHKHLQIKVLQQQNIPFLPDGNGWPQVLKDYVYSLWGIKKISSKPREPNFDAIKNFGVRNGKKKENTSISAT